MWPTAGSQSGPNSSSRLLLVSRPVLTSGVMMVGTPGNRVPSKPMGQAKPGRTSSKPASRASACTSDVCRACDICSIVLKNWSNLTSHDVGFAK